MTRSQRPWISKGALPRGVTARKSEKNKNNQKGDFITKTTKIIIACILSIVIAASFCLTCLAYNVDLQNSWLTLTDIIIDENYGVTPLGVYSCSFTLTTGTGNMSYSLNINPPQLNPAIYAKSRLVYTLKELNMDYSTLYSFYVTYYVPYTPNPISFNEYYYAYIVNPNNASNLTYMQDLNGQNSTQTTSVTVNEHFDVNHFYYFNIDLSSLYKTQFYGEKNFDIVCVPIASYSNFHYYY